MGRRRKAFEHLQGTATHRRTQDAYLAAMLDAVSEAEWGDIVRAAVAQAKAGDASARSFLAAYLIGRPAANAPTPLTVVVQQITGRDPLVEKIAQPLVNRIRFPSLPDEHEVDDAIQAEIAAELARKLPAPVPEDASVQQEGGNGRSASTGAEFGESAG